MDNSENKNNTDSTTEKVVEDKKERTFFSKLGVFALLFVSISILIGLIVLVIKFWKYFINHALKGTFFGDHIVLTIALFILLDIVGWVLYVVFSDKE